MIANMRQNEKKEKKIQNAFNREDDIKWLIE